MRRYPGKGSALASRRKLMESSCPTDSGRGRGPVECDEERRPLPGLLSSTGGLGNSRDGAIPSLARQTLPNRRSQTGPCPEWASIRRASRPDLSGGGPARFSEVWPSECPTVRVQVDSDGRKPL